MKDSVSWAAGHNHERLIGYRYRRVNQCSFLCWNPKCVNAQNACRIPASRLDATNNCWVQNLCTCRATSVMSLRQRRNPSRRNHLYDDDGVSEEIAFARGVTSVMGSVSTAGSTTSSTSPSQDPTRTNQGIQDTVLDSEQASVVELKDVILSDVEENEIQWVPSDAE